MLVFSCLSKNSGKGTKRFFTLSAVLVLSFCVVPLVSVSDVRANGLNGINANGPIQFILSQFHAESDALTIVKPAAKKFSIESDSTGIIFKRGRANVNNYLDGGSTLLKKLVGIVFAPLFYCFRHPLIFLVAFFCLSVLFILMEHFINSSKNDEFTMIDRRNRSKGKQHQNAAPYVLFIKEKERRANDNRKSLPDKQQVRIS